MRLAIIALLLLGTVTSAAATDADPAELITIAAVGDIMLGSDYPVPRLPHNNGLLLLRHATPFFLNADIAMANLEGPLVSGGIPAKFSVAGKNYVFRTPPEYADTLRDAGLTLLSIANNHAYDFGQEGLKSTRKALKSAGVGYSGKYGDISAFDIRGISVGIIAFSWGPPPRSILHPAEAQAEIKEAAGRFDILILTIHGGAEGKGALHIAEGGEYFLDEPRGDLIRFSRDAVDNGADLVVIHGPHVPRGMEIYRDRLIAYSLGNFCTYGGISVSGASGYAPLLQVTLDRSGAFVGGSIASFMQRPYAGPRPDTQRRSLKLIRDLSAADFPETSPFFSDDGQIMTRALTAAAVP